MTSSPTPSARGPAAEQTPLGEVTVLVYGWEKGRSEVRVRFPDDAKPDAPNAAANQARFTQVVMRELTEGLRIMSGG